VDAALQVVAASLAVVASREDAGRSAASMAAVGSTAAADSTVAVVASTVVAVDMAAVDTGKSRFERYRSRTETVTAGSKSCQPFLSLASDSLRQVQRNQRLASHSTHCADKSIPEPAFLARMSGSRRRCGSSKISA
jgi:hypothetical protein